MQIPKPTDTDRQRFRAPRVGDQADVGQQRRVVNGHMFMALFGSDVGVKLDEPDRSKLSATPGAGPLGPRDRPMGGYVTLRAEWTSRKASPWIAKAQATAAALPAKQPKKTSKQ